jgi:ech hydrogenase subunit D
MPEMETHLIEEIEPESLIPIVDTIKLDGFRLVQILCVAVPDGFELYYSFGGGYSMRSLKLRIGTRDPVPSITPCYQAAFLYENEIRDLFGVRIERIGLDWNGKLYDVAGNAPFAKASVRLTSSERPTALPHVGPSGPGDKK